MLNFLNTIIFTCSRDSIIVQLFVVAWQNSRNSVENISPFFQSFFACRRTCKCAISHSIIIIFKANCGHSSWICRSSRICQMILCEKCSIDIKVIVNGKCACVSGHLLNKCNYLIRFLIATSIFNMIYVYLFSCDFAESKNTRDLCVYKTFRLVAFRNVHFVHFRFDKIALQSNSLCFVCFLFEQEKESK